MDFLFLYTIRFDDSSLSFYEQEVDASLSLTANLKQAFRELDLLNNPYQRVNVLMADKRLPSFRLNSLRTNRRKSYSIIITLQTRK